MSPAVTDWDQDSIGMGPDFLRSILLAGILRSHLRPGDRVLDVGCNTGDLCVLLNAQFEYTGVDIAPDAIAKATARGGGRFICAQAEDFNPDKAFRAVVFNESLYYFSDPLALLHKFHREVQAGGFLALSIYKHGGLLASNARALRIARRFLRDTYNILYDTALGANGMRWNILVGQKNS